MMVPKLMIVKVKSLNRIEELKRVIHLKTRSAYFSRQLGAYLELCDAQL